MPDEQREKISITSAIEGTDWTGYAGPASAVRRRGERRRRRRQATAALGTTLAVVGVAIGVAGAGGRSGTAAAAKPSRWVARTTTPDLPASYPSFPAKLPTKPLLVRDPGRVLKTGVIGAGSVSGHHWQISYRVIPSGSSANSKPVVTMTDLSLDGTTVPISGTEGPTFSGIHGYQAMDQFFRNTGLTDPMIVATGTPSPGVTAVDLRWANGDVVQVPIYAVNGVRWASFAWDPANPPQAVEQITPSGVQPITITRDGVGTWTYGDPGKPITPTSPPTLTMPTAAPNLSQTPHVPPILSGLLGAGTMDGHTWQASYEIIPSGSPSDGSDEEFCTDTTVDGTTRQGGCTSARPFASRGISFDQVGGRDQPPLVVGFGAVDPGTTAIGFEWADGTKTVYPVQSVEGTPMAALALNPAHVPTSVLEFGSYGEYRISVRGGGSFSWRFNW